MTIESIRPQAGVWLRVVPTAVLIGCAWALAWNTGGSIDTSDWVPLLMAFGLTTAFLHYWLDRAVYRLSDRRIREAARGLLV